MINMKNVTPIYDVWLKEYGAEREVLFSIDFERPELVNLDSRDVLDYAKACAGNVLVYMQQAVDCILAGDCWRDDEFIDSGFMQLEAALGAFYIGNYYYEEMQDAIEVLADRDFMLKPETAQFFMWVIQMWTYKYGGNKDGED